MAYVKRFAGGFLDFPNTTTPIDSAFLNAVEAALLKLLDTDGTVDGQVAQWIQASSKYGPALILNKNVDAAAAIVKSKLDFTGANGLVNADVAGAAAIARSKLDFGSGLVNTDIAAAAAIVASKLSGYPADSTKFLRGDGTWTVPINKTVQTFVDSGSTDFFSPGLWHVEVDVGNLLGGALVYMGNNTATGTKHITVIGSGANSVGSIPTFAAVNQDTNTGVLRVSTATASGATITVTYRRMAQ